MTTDVLLKLRSQVRTFKYAFGAALLLVGANLSGAKNWALKGVLNAHDPTLLKEGEGWWCLSTGPGIRAKYSTDGLTWQARPPLLAKADPWWKTYAPAQRPLDVWAPDLHAFGGRVWCYYCVSEFGRNNSAIGLMSCTSLVMGDWRDDGFVLGSKQGTDAYNALDPSLCVDAIGKPWLVFGSWFDGIHLVPLDPATMKPTGALISLARRENGIEAPTIVYANRYYYLFVSVDRCCRGVNSTYKIAYGRSDKITGPYLDKNGLELTAGGGSILDAGDAHLVGPGGQSVVPIDQGWIIVRHAYDATNQGLPTLLISDLYWDKDGWPSYGGESSE